MAFTFKARLKDVRGKAISGADVQACLFNTAGNPYTVATGRSTTTGYVTLRTSRNIPTFQPRVLLRRKQGNSWVRLSETPKTFKSGVVDFGDLVVDTAPVARVGTMPVYAMNMMVVKPEAAGVKQAKISPETQKQLKTLQTTNLSLNRQISGHRVALQQAVAKAKADEQKAANARIAAKEKQLADLQKNLKSLQAKQGGQTSMAELFESTGRQIESARSRMATSKSAYKLGKIQMKLKVLPTSSMEAIRLVSKEEKDAAAGASELTFDFSPDAAATKAAVVKKEVPKVIGYTRAMAERKLASQNFALSVVEELVETEEKGVSQHGRVINQSPVNGEEAVEGSTVVLTVAREIGRK